VGFFTAKSSDDDILNVPQFSSESSASLSSQPEDIGGYCDYG
jgi:hypothetical protein